MLVPVASLIGTWTGNGVADYPTIERTEYREKLSIQLDEKQSILQYEQKTWVVADDSLLHWEFGFIRPLDDGRIEMVNTQNNGRVEVLKGHVSHEARPMLITFYSFAFANDPRMMQSRREITVEDTQLKYRQFIATQNNPELTIHLTATLNRFQDS